MMSVRDIPWVLLMALSTRSNIDGLDVRIAASPEETPEVIEKVGAACQVISRYAPYLYGRMRRALKRILVTEASGGQYLPRLETCRIGVGFVRRASPLELAMMLTHEATHARLWKAGFRYDERCRARIERICVGAEVALAERVPDSAPEIAKARDLLRTEWWTEQETITRSSEDLRRLGCPEWIIRRLS